MSAAPAGVVLSRRVLTGHVLLRMAPGHTVAAAIAFGAARGAVTAPVRAVLLCAGEAVAVAALLTHELTVATVTAGLGFSRARCARHAVAFASRSRFGDVLSGVGILHAAVAADQAMIAVVAAVGLICGVRAGLVFVPAAIGAVVAIRVVSAVGAIVRVGARVVVGVRMERAVVAVDSRPEKLLSQRQSAPSTAHA